MINSWKHKGLKELFFAGRSGKINSKLQGRIIRRLDALQAASGPEDLKIPGFDFHVLKGYKPPRYTIHVNGPLCITFEFRHGHAEQVNFENYH